MTQRGGDKEWVEEIDTSQEAKEQYRIQMSKEENEEAEKSGNKLNNTCTVKCNNRKHHVVHNDKELIIL